MKFPTFSSSRTRPAQSSEPPRETQKEKQEDSPTGSAWSTALLMVGSALVGATAVAVWNRRTIAEMRNHLLLNSGQAASGRTDEPPQTADEIF